MTGGDEVGELGPGGGEGQGEGEVEQQLERRRRPPRLVGVTPRQRLQPMAQGESTRVSGSEHRHSLPCCGTGVTAECS